jgi:phosphopantothenoylcysteine decarboxylase/phosphopantothenate--cysteine ligase
MVSTTLLSSKAPKIIVPAMNTAMYENPITQHNLEKLSKFGFEIMEPDFGEMACGTCGKGRFPEINQIYGKIIQVLSSKNSTPLTGKKILITAGGTIEDIDPVRYITNHSSGKMGYALARAARMRGAEVVLVSGQTALTAPAGVSVIYVKSSQEMHDAVLEHAESSDMIFKAAAVADYTPLTVADQKIKKKDGEMVIELKRTSDILGDIAKIRRDDQVICGFSMETENLIENSRSKLERKSLDLICANSLRTEGAGFRGDTNIITIITKDSITELGKLSKLETAHRIIDIACQMKAVKAERSK